MLSAWKREEPKLVVTAEIIFIDIRLGDKESVRIRSLFLDFTVLGSAWRWPS